MTNKSWSPSQKCFEEAFRHHQFSIFFQPQVLLADNAVCGAEVLVRWRHPEQGVLLPHRFLPHMGGTPFEERLNACILYQTRQAQHVFQAEGLGIPLSVNVSPRQLMHPAFLALLDCHGDEFPEGELASLEFEILESEPLLDVDAAARIMNAARRRGVRFALDDFGVGHASLRHCKRLPLHKLKLDKSFVAPMLEGELYATLVRRSIELGKELGLTVLAEGVETEAQRDRLIQLGCDQGQGYLFARPMPQAAFIRWVKGRRAPH